MNIVSFSQSKNSIKDSLFFSKGIYLENLRILIPWKINYSEPNNYGNPTISKKPKRWFSIQVKWDSVRIINNFLVNLYIEAPKGFLSKKKEMRVLGFKALLDSSTASNIISYIKTYTGKKGGRGVKRKNSYTRWDIDDCRITIGYDRYWGNYLLITNNKS